MFLVLEYFLNARTYLSCFKVEFGAICIMGVLMQLPNREVAVNADLGSVGNDREALQNRRKELIFQQNLLELYIQQISHKSDLYCQRKDATKRIPTIGRKIQCDTSQRSAEQRYRDDVLSNDHTRRSESCDNRNNIRGQLALVCSLCITISKNTAHPEEKI